MTHEELLDRIAQAGLEPEGNVMPTHLVLALRAVVELHKPITIGNGFNYIPKVLFKEKCEYCNGIYPCGIIRAIEKELV